jgi:RimJ/RimL family protein N-acetyltransferase
MNDDLNRQDAKRTVQETRVTIRPWAVGDLPLLARLMGDPDMTTYVGGPETPEELRKRNVRYSDHDPEKGSMYVILVGQARIPAGSIGYWDTEWQGQMVWETGWSVLPEFQRMGVASKATGLVVEAARANGRYRYLHAYPLVQNAASNGVCRKAGFTLLGEVEFEDRRAPGHFKRYNDWRIDLFGETT